MLISVIDLLYWLKITINNTSPIIEKVLSMSAIEDITDEINKRVINYLDESIGKAITYYKKYKKAEVIVKNMDFENRTVTFSLAVVDNGCIKKSGELTQTFDFIDSLNAGNIYAFEDIESMLEVLTEYAS